jgi:hypothetical protein
MRTRALPTRFLKAIISAGVLVILPTLAEASWGEAEDLGKISRVDLIIDVSGSGVTKEGLTNEWLRDEVTVVLRAKMPRLLVAQARGDASLAVSVHVGALEHGQGFYGVVQVELFRWVIIQATGKESFVSVWRHGLAIKGPPMASRKAIREGSEDKLTRFAADWYRGNP